MTEFKEFSNLTGMSFDDYQKLLHNLQTHFGDKLLYSNSDFDEITIEVAPQHLLEVCQILREENIFQFEMLLDVAGVDYLKYGISEWVTETAADTGYSRGVEKYNPETPWPKPRFAVVYHLLSIVHNQRLRLKTFTDCEPPIIPSVTSIWNSANWYEREAFDLFGIFFEGHPDLRRLLTDYGFIGHPFRKDFPVFGKVEVRYSAKDKRVIYEAVSIPARTLVPKTIRQE